MQYIKPFSQLRLTDTPLVGGKNASLGQMIADLQEAGVRVPNGFAITAQAYWAVLDHNDIRQSLTELLAKIDTDNLTNLRQTAQQIRSLIEGAQLPQELQQEIKEAYGTLSAQYGVAWCDVAVRSSATAEDLPTASFAGQQDTFLNVQGVTELFAACTKSMASLFTDRALVYRVQHGFEHAKVALSVGVQKMVRADLGSAGVAFSLDTETGFKEVVSIDSAFGLGESIVKGIVSPDEFMVFKTTLMQNYRPIIQKTLGAKETKIVYGKDQSEATKQVPTTAQERASFSLTDDQVLEIARMVMAIEDRYSQLNNRWSPMDVEWAVDGVDHKLYIVQARPETVHAQQGNALLIEYELPERTQLQHNALLTGQSIGQKIVTGRARVVRSVADCKNVQSDEILVTSMTDPDWVPVMKKVAGIITDLGGRTCHAAIVSRELEIPALVGTHGATKVLRNGQEITLDCSQTTGYVYDGHVSFKVREISVDTLPESPVPLLVNIAQSDTALRRSFLPVQGVGLARTEFIFSDSIKVHPMACVDPEQVQDKAARAEIEALIAPYGDGKTYCIEKLSQGIGMIAAAFFPRPVIVRMSDFKSNEYRNLLGGTSFEPEEANPMLGFRGASRYTHERYAPAFALECAAFLRARKEMGLHNIKIMIPFVRTVTEAQQVIAALVENGLVRGTDGLELVMMVEVPSNVILIKEFSQLFDGFSIGSNDLTQLVLGVDRDSALLAAQFDERDPAVKEMLAQAIAGAHSQGRFIGICGQAPSDYPELAKFLIDQKIDSLSLNPDAIVPFLLRKR